MNKRILIVSIIAIASFGPYLFPQFGLRLEHIVIYCLFFLSLLITVTSKIYIHKSLIIILILWVFMFAWISFTSLWTVDTSQDYYSVFAAIENVLQPLALLLIMSIIVINLQEVSTIKTALVSFVAIVITILSLNTVWITIGLFVDLTPINQLFWGGRGVEISSVALRAASLGRHSGIINQPLESGMLYSFGLLIWAYTASFKSKLKIADIIMLALLIVGGFYSVSKVFIFGGVPLFLLYVLLDKKLYMVNYYKYLLLIPIAIGIDHFYGNFWSGYTRLQRFILAITEQSLFQTIFQTRYGSSDSGVIAKFMKTWNESPLYGYGFGWHAAYDNAYLEIFMYGGIVALLFYILVTIALLCFGIKYYLKDKSNEAKLILFITIFIIIAGTGGPTLIANRFATLFWVLICLLFNVATKSIVIKAQKTELMFEKTG